MQIFKKKNEIQKKHIILVKKTYIDQIKNSSTSTRNILGVVLFYFISKIFRKTKNSDF